MNEAVSGSDYARIRSKDSSSRTFSATSRMDEAVRLSSDVEALSGLSGMLCARFKVSGRSIHAADQDERRLCVDGTSMLAG